MKTFPTLYKKNTQGTIEQWSIFVNQDRVRGYRVTTAFGEYDGKIQVKAYMVNEGKNIGKKNETSIKDQAWNEAHAKWEKKLKSGYVQSYEDAIAGKVDKIIAGGILPMLAHKFKDYKDKIEYPVYVQPKLDGQRCIAIKIDGKITLWTRTRKAITSCPHIIEHLEKLLKKHEHNMFLDGELYVHGKINFEALMSAVRKQKPSEESKQVEYHVYDAEVFDDLASPFELRKEFVENLKPTSHIKIVEADLCLDEDSVHENHDHFTRNGYEGLMIRNPNGVYDNKRSVNLLKLKNFIDEECEIVDVKACKDRTVVFVCKYGKQFFEATMSGEKDFNQVYLKDHSTWEGKQLTVRYQRLTADGVPLFPVGVRIREDL